VMLCGCGAHKLGGKDLVGDAGGGGGGGGGGALLLPGNK